MEHEHNGIVIGVLEMDPNGLVRGLEELEIGGQVETTPTAVLLISVRMQETVDLLSQ